MTFPPAAVIPMGPKNLSNFFRDRFVPNFSLGQKTRHCNARTNLPVKNAHSSGNRQVSDRSRHTFHERTSSCTDGKLRNARLQCARVGWVPAVCEVGISSQYCAGLPQTTMRDNLGLMQDVLCAETMTPRMFMSN